MNNKIKVGFESPSNIALIKYWGKFGEQLPMNPSLSITLTHCKTKMEIEYWPINKFELDFFFEGMVNEKFQAKMEKKLKRFVSFFPWLSNAHLIIHSSNTFPHSSGIASSASSMSALALCLVLLDEKINKRQYQKNEKDHFASALARLGSGSASRSIYAQGSLWGLTSLVSNSSNEFAVGFNNFHPRFRDMFDAILIIDSNEKSVSSSAGHELMINHPHRVSRINHANENLRQLLAALNLGDFKAFSEVVEREALDLHSMMMTSNPSFILLSPDSLKAINAIRDFRNTTNAEITFTIDAGPNIHVLYTKKDQMIIEEFLKNKILNTKIAKSIVWDQMGTGPKDISDE